MIDATQIHFLKETDSKFFKSETERLTEDSRAFRHALKDKLEQELRIIEDYKKMRVSNRYLCNND